MASGGVGDVWHGLTMLSCLIVRSSSSSEISCHRVYRILRALWNSHHIKSKGDGYSGLNHPRADNAFVAFMRSLCWADTTGIVTSGLPIDGMPKLYIVIQVTGAGAGAGAGAVIFDIPSPPVGRVLSVLELDRPEWALLPLLYSQLGVRQVQDM